MKAICVDDEGLIAEHMAALCRRLPQLDGAQSFTSSQDALAWLEENTADVALLDIDMPDMNGIELAGRIKLIHPNISIIFLTGYSKYAVDAFQIHASGYLLKPVNREELAVEMAYALSGKTEEATVHISVKTFGGFDVFVDGKEVLFKQSKCKELLAVLIDRRGSSMTRAEVFAIIWEDRQYDRSMQKQLDVIIRATRNTLREYGIEDIFVLKGGKMRIRPELLDCDMYRFFDGDVAAFNAYRGEYMNPYSWASMSEGFITRK